MKKDLPWDDAGKRYRNHRRLVRGGQALMVVGALVALAHLIAHMSIVGGPPVIQDLLIGYPTGGLLVLAGAVMAGQTATKKR